MENMRYQGMTASVERETDTVSLENISNEVNKKSRIHTGPGTLTLDKPVSFMDLQTEFRYLMSGRDLPD